MLVLSSVLGGPNALDLPEKPQQGPGELVYPLMCSQSPEKTNALVSLMLKVEWQGKRKPVL